MSRASSVRQFVLRNLFVACLAILCWGPGGACTAIAQLSVLSEGDPARQWQKVQIASLEEQLANAATQDALRRELQSQLKWLRLWKPGQLTEAPLWKQDESARQRLSEPIIDPDGLATSLRQRLLGSEATPTTDDTDELQALLSEHPDDVGVRQLHLHWLDQSVYRKTYPMEIADAAIRLVGLLEQLRPQTPDIESARAYCLYRRGRALAYRELPDVIKQNPIEDPAQHAAELLGAYNQLVDMVGRRQPEFILLDIRMLRRDRWNGQALALLEDHAGAIEKRWFLKKRRDLLHELGWELPAKEAGSLYSAAFPDAEPVEPKTLEVR